MVLVGAILAIVGLIFPVPGPLDDPVDFIGYLMMVLGILKNMLSK